MMAQLNAMLVLNYNFLVLVLILFLLDMVLLSLYILHYLAYYLLMAGIVLGLV